MSRFTEFFATQQEASQLRRELESLRQENARLRAQNDSMREGMRRCVTCDYRLDFKRRQGDAPVAAGKPSETTASDTSSTNN